MNIYIESKLFMQKTKDNFLPNQYKNDSKLTINHNYLYEQFKDCENIFKDIKKLVIRGDFTLGRAVNEFEDKLKKITKTKYVVGVNSGTDAITLSLKALGIQSGDEVITTPYTFYATIGAIVSMGAKPVFVDIGYDYNLDITKIETKINKKTKAIVPVHWSGLICDMRQISKIAKKYRIAIVEDACHAINAEKEGYKAGYFSDTACFSLHPLKNINVWGDGGFIATNSKKIYQKLILLRNHGLQSRDVCKIFAGNSRLDTLQAIVGLNIIKKINFITNSRISNSNFFDKELSDIPELNIPIRAKNVKQVFHIYVIRAKKRNQLKKYLSSNGIDAKIHYPIPMHLQPAAKFLKYKKGDFPITENICKSVISLPVHEFITKSQRAFVVKKIKEFYTQL